MTTLEERKDQLVKVQVFKIISSHDKWKKVSGLTWHQQQYQHETDPWTKKSNKIPTNLEVRTNYIFVCVVDTWDKIPPKSGRQKIRISSGDYMYRAHQSCCERPEEP
jgi:hypothetical protein